MENSVKAGIGLVGVAVVAIIGFAVAGQKPPGVTCKVSAAGVALIADSLKTRGTAAALAGAGGGAIAANEACEYFLKQLDKDPDKKQTIEVQTNEGVVQDQLSRRDLTLPPPPPPASPGNIDLVYTLRCVRAYDVQVLREWCYDRTISPEAVGY
jgi:hypothetical protein